METLKYGTRFARFEYMVRLNAIFTLLSKDYQIFKRKNIQKSCLKDNQLTLSVEIFITYLISSLLRKACALYFGMKSLRNANSYLCYHMKVHSHSLVYDMCHEIPEQHISLLRYWTKWQLKFSVRHFASNCIWLLWNFRKNLYLFLQWNIIIYITLFRQEFKQKAMWYILYIFTIRYNNPIDIYFE